MFCVVISDKDFDLEEKELVNPKRRIGARGIVVNENGEIAIFNKQAKNEFKLPGGGIDEGEEPQDAFVREIFEETGCSIKEIECIGYIDEIQSQENFAQHSYVFISKVEKMGKELHLTQKEKDEKAQLLWLKPKEALSKMRDCLNNLQESVYDNVYRSKFMVTRDCKILELFLDSKEG